MSDLNSAGRARRRLAGLLASTPWVAAPWAGALHAAVLPSAASQPPADGSPFTGRWVHAFAAYGAPKYGPEYTHFDYVNPQAPKGGTLKLKNPDRRTSFDKFNPFTTRGNSPAGVLIWMMEGLAQLSSDEPASMYALLAESFLVEPDFSAVTFRIRSQARFANGDQVTAADVVHSFKALSGKGAAPTYQTALAGIARAEAVDERTVRFEMKDKTRDQVFVAGTMPVFSRKWGEGKKLDEIVTEYPISTGPYVISKVDMPRRIEFVRNPNYWAGALPVRRGHFNFDRVIYRNYADNAVAREAFKAGEFDLLMEYGARSWVRLHKGAKWDDGRIVKRPMTTGYGQYMQIFALNMRRPLFQDIRVREALNLTYDFENINRTGLFKRAQSMFNNSVFAAEGLPTPAELKLLEPFRAELPPRVFGPAYRAPRTDTAPSALRANLLRARALLEEAGWKLDSSGVLRNGKGEPFEFEYLIPRDSNEADWQNLLKKLGITLKERTVDFALYRTRLQKYDFDMVGLAGGNFTLPDAGELQTIMGSKAYDEPGNNNFRGVKSRAVDTLIDAIARAETLQQLQDASRALDRVVTWSFFQIPVLYNNVETVSHWDRFGIPKVQALYFRADAYFTAINENAPWPLWTWWDKAKDKALAQAPEGKR